MVLIVVGGSGTATCLRTSTSIGHANVPSRLAADASMLYAKNLLNFITPMVDAETKELAIDWEDEVVTGTLVTKDGKVVNDRVPATTVSKKESAKKEQPKEAAKKEA